MYATQTEIKGQELHFGDLGIQSSSLEGTYVPESELCSTHPYWEDWEGHTTSWILLWMNNDGEAYQWRELNLSNLPISEFKALERPLVPMTTFKAEEYINNKTFMLTYGDGVCDVDIKKLVDFHQKNKTRATMTAIQPAGRFGALDINSNIVNEFVEKPAGDGNWINGGFMVCEPEVLELIDSDQTVFEQEPLQTLASDGELSAYKHDGFWQCMDTLRDKTALNKLWDDGKAPWKVW